MASLIVAGDTSGTVTLQAPAIAGSTVLTLPTTSGTIVTTAGGSTVPFALGSASSPSITFTGDTNTGIFSPGADTIAFSEGGVESMRIDSSGNAFINCSTSQISGIGTGRLNVNGGQGVYISGYGDALGFGSVFKQSASASGNLGWPIYFVSSAEAKVGGIRQNAFTVQFETAASSTVGATLLNTGVQFAATQIASSNVNTLDDYEEGTWTPAFTGGAPTYTQQNGWYTKIGNVVTAWGSIIITAKSASGVEAGIVGLPFPSALISTSVASWGREYLPAGVLPSSAHGAFASVEGSVAYIRNNSGSLNSYSMDNLAASGSLTFGVTYRTAT